MAETMIKGPAGRLEAKFQFATDKTAPAVLVLHPHPLHGGTMNNKVTYTMYRAFSDAGAHVMRFNFRGAGQSEGQHEGSEGELSDAAAALDWLETQLPLARSYWVTGFSFGAWIALQLLVRRPEIKTFYVVSPPADRYDFSFLGACPVSGKIIQGSADTVVNPESVITFHEKIKRQKGIKIDLDIVESADHFFTQHLDELRAHIASFCAQHHVEKK